MFIFIILMGLLIYYVYQYDNRHNPIIVRRYYEQLCSAELSTIEYVAIVIGVVFLVVVIFAAILE
jgi:hypothetical protein